MKAPDQTPRVIDLFAPWRDLANSEGLILTLDACPPQQPQPQPPPSKQYWHFSGVDLPGVQ